MKKRLGLMMFLVVLVLFCGSVLASDVGYILKKSRSVDSCFLNVFSEMGLTVDLIEDKDIPNTDFSEYDFIFVGDDRLKNVKDIPVDVIPSVITNGFYGKELGVLEKGRISRLACNRELKIKKIMR